MDKNLRKGKGQGEAERSLKDSGLSGVEEFMDRPEQETAPGHPASADPEHWKATSIFTDEQTGSTKINFKDLPLNIHRTLTRAQSSVAIQLRSEHIGLNSYLYRRKVPGVEKPSYQCGYPSQNVKHMVLACL